MSRKKKEDIVETTAKIVEQPALKEYKNVAFGIHKLIDEAGAVNYILVEIPYDPETGDTGFIKELAKDIYEDILDKFKMRAGELFSDIKN